nr:MAG: hypothetical protein [Bacteriophage sp.]
MKTTPIYGLPYIEVGDLVSSAPAQFKTMAEGFENALNEVDSRNTPAGVKPAIATTLETLAGITGVTGQAGYVTADPAEGNNGPYCWTGSAWARIATISDVSDILAEDSSTVMLINSTYGTIKGYRRGKLATLRIDWKSSASGSWTKGDFGKLPEGWWPLFDLNFSFGGRDGANQKTINVRANGTMDYTNNGGTQGTESFGCSLSYAIA